MSRQPPAFVSRLSVQALHRVNRAHKLHRPPRRKIILQKQYPLDAASIRSASSTSRLASSTASLSYKRIKNALSATALGFFICCGYLYVTDVRAGIHQWAVAPSLQWIYDDAEEAHEAGTESLKRLYSWGLHPRERGNEDKSGDLNVEVLHDLSLDVMDKA